MTFLLSYGLLTAGSCAQQADSHNRGCLSFEDFTHFVKLLKARPEVKRLYKKLSAYNNNTFDYEVFKRFMRESQGVRVHILAFGLDVPDVLTSSSEHPCGRGTCIVVREIFSSH